jgi:hypothetical protein
MSVVRCNTSVATMAAAPITLVAKSAIVLSTSLTVVETHLRSSSSLSQNQASRIDADERNQGASHLLSNRDLVGADIVASHDSGTAQPKWEVTWWFAFDGENSRLCWVGSSSEHPSPTRSSQ